MPEFDSEELKQAVALFYDGDNNPVVTAKGDAELAQEIIDIACQHGVPLCDNAPLVALLSQLELGDEIPEQLYICIAQIISFAWQLTGKTPEIP